MSVFEHPGPAKSGVADGVSEAEHLERVERQRAQALAEVERLRTLVRRLESEVRHLKIERIESGLLVADLQQGLAAALATIERVKAIHHPGPNRAAEWCQHDGYTWPCLTTRALDKPFNEQRWER